MHYWLVKTEPETYSFHDLERDGHTLWDGVRNYQARNNLKAMRKGDSVFVYHSVHEKCIVGMAEVIGEARQDPTTDDSRWVCVDLCVGYKFPHPISLERIKQEKPLEHIALVRQGRLSVMPLALEDAQLLLQMSEGK